MPGIPCAESGMIYYPVPREIWGWPKGMAQEDTEQMTAAVLAVLKQRGPQTLRGMYEWLQRPPYRDLTPQCYRDFIAWDWIYCAIERALRATDAERVYRLPPAAF